MQEALPCAKGDLFPKATKSSVGAEGTTPPGNSTTIDPAAALGTQTEMLTDVKATSSGRTMGKSVIRRTIGRARPWRTATRHLGKACTSQARAHTVAHQGGTEKPASTTATRGEAAVDEKLTRQGTLTAGLNEPSSSYSRTRRGHRLRWSIGNITHQVQRALRFHPRTALPSMEFTTGTSGRA